MDQCAEETINTDTDDAVPHSQTEEERNEGGGDVYNADVRAWGWVYGRLTRSIGRGRNRGCVGSRVIR